MTIAFDASVGGTATGTSLALPSLTTAQANEIIITTFDGNADHLTAPTSSPSLTWNQIDLQGSGPPPIGAWWALAATPQAYTITGNQNSSAFLTGCAFAIQGANTTTPLDADSPVYSASDPASLSTVNGNTMIVGCLRMGVASPTSGAGFTQVYGANFTLVEYQIVSSIQSSLSIGATTGTGTSNGVIAFAIVAASGSAAAFASLAVPRKLYLRPKPKFYR